MQVNFIVYFTSSVDLTPNYVQVNFKVYFTSRVDLIIDCYESRFFKFIQKMLIWSSKDLPAEQQNTIHFFNILKLIRLKIKKNFSLRVYHKVPFFIRRLVSTYRQIIRRPPPAIIIFDHLFL